MFSDGSEKLLNNALPCFKDYKGQQFSKGINGTLKNEKKKRLGTCTIITFSLVR